MCMQYAVCSMYYSPMHSAFVPGTFKRSLQSTSTRKMPKRMHSAHIHTHVDSIAKVCIRKEIVQLNVYICCVFLHAYHAPWPR